MGERVEIKQFYTWQFAGAFPDIPLPADINIEELTQGDSNPMFITLPFAESNAVASDGLRYTDGFNSKLVAEINANRPVGNMGHIPEDMRSSMFPLPAVQWLCAQMDGEGRAWAKGLVMPNAELRQFVKVSKATKRGISTSIVGYSDYNAMQFNADGTYEIDPTGFDLESLDLAPIERAALQIPRPTEITAQMQKSEKEKEKMAITPELIAQLTADQANLLPAPVREAIIAQFAAQNEDKQKIEHLQKDNNELALLVSQLKSEITKRDDELFGSRLDEAIDSEVKIEDTELKGIVRNTVLLHMGGERDLEKATEFLAQYVTSDSYKRIAQAFVAQLSGGRAIVGEDVNQNKGGETLGAKMEKHIDQLLNEYGVKTGKAN